MKINTVINTSFVPTSERSFLFDDLQLIQLQLVNPDENEIDPEQDPSMDNTGEEGMMGNEDPSMVGGTKL